MHQPTAYTGIFEQALERLANKSLAAASMPVETGVMADLPDAKVIPEKEQKLAQLVIRCVQMYNDLQNHKNDPSFSFTGAELTVEHAAIKNSSALGAVHISEDEAKRLFETLRSHFASAKKD